MRTLQDTFDQKLKELLKPERLGTELVTKKLKDLGIELTESQLSKIKAQFVNLNGDTFNLEFEDEQVLKAGFKSKNEFEDALSHFFVDLSADLKDFSDRFLEDLPSLITETTDELSQKILHDLRNDSKRMLEDHRQDLGAFQTNLREVWGHAFDLLEMFIVISLEAGESFGKEYGAAASDTSDYVFEVLIRSHARACQIAYEILTLLKSGLADGAHARWRSLHEISVISIFISTYGNELAERYLLHDGIESCKAATIYKEHCEELGYERLTEAELSGLKDVHDGLISRFGNGYKSDYGWASEVIGNDRPTFRQIEQFAGLEHLRPHYKMACHNIHANPKGLFFRLGLYPESGDTLLAGPSNVGLTDPGHSTAISLAQITAALLTHQPNIDRMVVCKILIELETEIGEALINAEMSLKGDETHNNGVE